MLSFSFWFWRVSLYAPFSNQETHIRNNFFMDYYYYFFLLPLIEFANCELNDI